MNFELRDYQREAAIGVLGRLGQARSAWQVDESRSAFALSAVTGSGKTVIATADGFGDRCRVLFPVDGLYECSRGHGERYGAAGPPRPGTAQNDG